MNVQLIHPPVYLNVHAMTALRPSLPLGLAYVAAALRRAGHAVSVIDAVAEAPDQVTQGARKQLFALGLTVPEIVARLDPAADVIGVTNMWSFSWPLVRELITAIKQARPDTPIVCGGEHFTGLAEHSMQQAPIDVIVLGEGEEGAVEVVAELAKERPDFAAIPSIVYRDASGQPVRSAAMRARKKDVDSIAWPAWDLFRIDTYNHHNYVNGVKMGKTIPILATRGCPYQCTYCSSPNMWTTKWYARNPKDVVDEIEHYYRTYQATNFPFQDLTAIVKRDWIIAFCNELLARKLPITWQFPSGTRCEVVDDEVAGLLARTGGRSLAFAPESGSERTRQLIQKRMKTESLLNAVKASVRNGLNITAFIVIGFPHDTEEDLEQTARLARKLALLGIDDIAVGFFFPIPNTRLYHELLARGRIRLDDDFLLTPIFANEEKLLPENCYCDHLDARRLTRWKYRILANFYGVSFARRPWRVAQIGWNALRGKETRKLETFLVDIRRKAGIALKNKVKSAFGRKKPAAAAG
ncbi:MAG TPA: radical SAM protein [Planctomycetota bacterium]|nr:radical SAM protein [Planctomycetota bacterium]